MRWLNGLACAVLAVLLAGGAFAQDQAAGEKYVSREEYEKLKAQMNTVLAELAEMRKERAANQSSREMQKKQLESALAEMGNLKKQQAAGPSDEKVLQQVAAIQTDVEALKKTQTQSTELEQWLNDINKELDDVKKKSNAVQFASTKFLLTGYGVAGYEDHRDAGSTFSAGFNPIFLWQLSDRILFEGELELRPTVSETGQSETDLSLEYANISYLLNDYVTVGGGKFLLPFGVFNERLHPAWINKLPDRPLPYSDELGIAPEAGIGAYVRGGAQAGPTKLNYALYVINGSSLITTKPDDAGKLDFDNFVDSNHNKAVGTRIGFLPIPELEFGYSFQYAKVGPTGFEDVNAHLHAVDASYIREIPPLLGTIDARVEWVWSHVSDATYDPTGALGFGPLSFNNRRNAGYAQLAYRPTRVNCKILKNMEFVTRYDMLNVPDGAPESFDQRRWTFGVDYWVTPSLVLKAAYELDRKENAPDDNVLLLQAALGF